MLVVYLYWLLRPHRYNYTIGSYVMIERRQGHWPLVLKTRLPFVFATLAQHSHGVCAIRSRCPVLRLRVLQGRAEQVCNHVMAESLPRTDHLPCLRRTTLEEATSTD